MSGWTDRQIEAIAERIRLASSPYTDYGVVTSVSADRQRAMVTFESATVAVPCKVSGNAWCEPDDKVGVIRFGAEWYVVAVLSRIQGPNFAGAGAVSPGGTTTSGTPGDVPGSPSFAFTKRWDTTPILIGASLSFFITGAAAQCACSLKFNGATTPTYLVWDQEPSSLSVRYDWSHTRVIPDVNTPTPLPAGVYQVNQQWHRSQGSGTLGNNQDDWQSAFVLEGGI